MQINCIIYSEATWQVFVRNRYCIKSNQIKSNHFYCHITTAQVPWWVKFLWACSRQCRKTTDNLPMDRQCKKNNRQFTYGQTVQKNNNRQFTYGQTVQKEQQTIYIWTDSAKKQQQTIYIWTDSAKRTTDNLHMDRQCKKTTTDNLHMDRQCKKNNRQFTYGQTVQKKLHWSIYSAPDKCKKTQQQQFTYGQTVQKNNSNLHMDRQCKKTTTDNLHMDRQCKKNNRQFTYGQTVQKKLHWSIYSAPDSAKKHNNSNLHMVL